MEITDFEKLLDFSEEFKKKKIAEEKKLPFHVNVIEELHINENGHSRVLTKLLQYRNEQKQYVILQSLLDYVSDISPEFNQIKIDKPDITQEKKRIDLWVRDTDYALIFENKVYNADDKEAQICRYIEETKKKYEEEQIFIIYLSRDGKEPDPQSWGKYKESFDSRYVNLSFKNDILPWLRDGILSKFNNNDKEKYLQSAILQYIDFLEGEQMFRTNSIYTDMNKNLETLINEWMNLQSCKNEAEQFKHLSGYINNFNDIVIQMKQKRKKILEKQALEWRKEIKKNFPQVKEFYDLKNEDCFGLCVNKKCSHKNVLLSIGYEDNNENDWIGKLYCQVQYEDNSPLKKELKEQISELNENHGDKTKEIWKYYKDDFEGVFDCFKDVLEKLLNMK